VKAAHVYATYVKTRREGITNNIEGLCQSLQRRRVEVRLDAPQVRLRDLNRRHTHLTKGWATRRLLMAAIDDPGVDLVHYHVSIAAMGIFGRMARMARPRNRKPILLHVWNALYRPEDTHGMPSRQDLTYHRMFNNPTMAHAGLRDAEAILVSSKFQQIQLEEAGIERPIHVVPNGIDTETYRPATAEERAAARAQLGATGEPTILYYGHLSAWKGVNHFVDALPLVFRENPKAQAVIAHTSYGNGEADLRRRLQRRGIADKVLVTGPSHVPSLLAAADVAVLPALGAVGSACHPNVLLEILASGMPAVASRVGSIPELIVDGVTGYLSRPGDPEDIAAHLNLLADDDGLRRRVGASARHDITENFDWNVVAERVGDVYMRYVDPAGVPAPSAVPDEVPVEAERVTA
jgi:glycosyltransferase involved in cell wall biosynthesis